MGKVSSYSIEAAGFNSWDEFYYNVAKQVGRNSKCLSRKIGSVLVRDKSIISTGYNGPPRGISTCDKRWFEDSEFMTTYAKEYEAIDGSVEGICPRRIIGFKSGEGLDICVAGHAERNSLINAAREGISTKHTTMYMTCGIPCTPCLVEIINAGVEEIVVTSFGFYDGSAGYLSQQSNIKIRLFDFIK